MLWWLFAACVVNEGGPSSPGSPAADALQQVESIRVRAETIEALSTELEGMTDAARQAMPGRPRRDEIARMRTLMDQIESENTALQSELQALEAQLHIAAGDPNSLPEPTP